MSQPRRMFSVKIVGSDAFLEMPASTRELYFQLGMYADDDGFINPLRIIRMVGASYDDLKLLCAKRFVIPFEDGVVVIKHWKINNMIRKDIYQPTVYLDHKLTLNIKENKSYTECQQNVDKMLTQVSSVKDRLDKVSIDTPAVEAPAVPTSSIHQRTISDRYIQLLKDRTKSATEPEGIKREVSWPRFWKHFKDRTDLTTESVLSALDAFFNDQWVKANLGFDPYHFAKNIDNFRAKAAVSKTKAHPIRDGADVDWDKEKKRTGAH